METPSAITVPNRGRWFCSTSTSRLLMMMNKGESCPSSPHPAREGLGTALPQRLFPPAGKCGCRTGQFCELAHAQQSHTSASTHGYVLDWWKHCRGWTGRSGRHQKPHRAPQHRTAPGRPRSCSPCADGRSCSRTRAAGALSWNPASWDGLVQEKYWVWYELHQNETRRKETSLR